MKLKKINLLAISWSFPGGASDKEPACPMQETQETWVRSLKGKIPWRRKWQLIPVFLSGESHGQRSLMDYSPWGREESDTAERLSLRTAETVAFLPKPSLDRWGNWDPEKRKDLPQVTAESGGKLEPDAGPQAHCPSSSSTTHYFLIPYSVQVPRLCDLLNSTWRVRIKWGTNKSSSLRHLQ